MTRRISIFNSIHFYAAREATRCRCPVAKAWLNEIVAGSWASLSMTSYVKIGEDRWRLTIWQYLSFVHFVHCSFLMFLGVLSAIFLCSDQRTFRAPTLIYSMHDGSLASWIISCRQQKLRGLVWLEIRRRLKYVTLSLRIAKTTA